jgi:hypothetical protein
MSEALNIVDNLELRLSLDSSSPELTSERNLYNFAHGVLAEVLDDVLSGVKVQGDVVVDSLTLDLDISASGDPFEQLASALRTALNSKIGSAVFRAQSAPLTNMLADVYRNHLPMEKSFNIERRFDSFAENWRNEHTGEDFKPLALAEAVIKNMQQEFPKLDIQQIAYVVYQRIMQMRSPQKSQKVCQGSAQASNVSNGVANVVYEVADAGLVLLSPYIPVLFQRAECLENGTFATDDAKLKALSILKYATFGSYAEPLKNSAVMNLLCGLPASPVFYVDELPKISDGEKELVDGLLQAVVANWKAVGSMSPDGLRSTFFVRQGTIDADGASDQLTVEKKTFDILLDKLPWGYSMIKHPWMKKVLNVKWR